MRTCGVSGGKVYESIGTSLNGVHPQPPAVHQNFYLKFLHFYGFRRCSSTKAGLGLIIWICLLSRLQCSHLSWKSHSQMNPNNVNTFQFVQCCCCCCCCKDETSKIFTCWCRNWKSVISFEDLVFLCQVECQLFQTSFINHDFQFLWKPLKGEHKNTNTCNLG